MESKQGSEPAEETKGGAEEESVHLQIAETGLNMKFEIGPPIEKGSHMQYLVKGADNQGPWEGLRRYSHFHELAEVLRLRWPGVYLPRLPPKKAIGNYQTEFLQQRRYFLERFVRRLGHFPYIVNSEEFMCFSRPQGDIEKILAKLTKLPTSQIIERVRTGLDIRESSYDANDKAQFAREISEFHSFANRTLIQMKDLKH